MKKESLFYGLISGFLGISAFGLYLEGQLVIEGLRFLILAIFIFFGLRAINKQTNTGLTFPEGIKAGLGIVSINALMMLLFTSLYFGAIRPDYFPNHKEQIYKKLNQQNQYNLHENETHVTKRYKIKTETELRNEVESKAGEYTAFNAGTFRMVETMLVGGFIVMAFSLILSAGNKQKNQRNKTV